VIGLTNRLDALDPALLRPGRFEVQIRFPLPDRAGRKQILDIHTATLRENKFLAKDADLDAIVDATASFSGADLAAVVRSATSHAMARLYESTPHTSEGANPPVSDADVGAMFRVTGKDLRRGMKEVLSVKAASASTEPYLKHGFVTYHTRIGAMMQRLKQFSNDVLSGASHSVTKLLIEGPPESGLTATAAAAARLAQFPHVHVVSPDAFIGLTPEEKVERLRQAFDAAMQAPAACLILDSLEHLLEFNQVGGRINTNIQLELAGLLRRRVATSSRQQGGGGAAPAAQEHEARVLIIATSSVGEAVRNLAGGVPIFDAVEIVQPLTRVDIAVVLGAYGVTAAPNELRLLAAQLPPALPIRRLVYWLSVAQGRAREQQNQPRAAASTSTNAGAAGERKPSLLKQQEGDSVLRPTSEKGASLNVFAELQQAEEEDTGSKPQEIPLALLRDVLAEYGVLDSIDAVDRLAEVVQW
jgi:hypothetical protein